ncbi:MAG: glycosyltransferase family 4 protein [Bacteroidales bacterium]|nr:glycosyltransferase family 4 protein [Bacteroidales bacterium]
MNILFIQTGLNPCSGGVQRVTYTIATELQRLGHNNFCIHFQDKAESLVVNPFVKCVFVTDIATGEKDIRHLISRNSINVVINQIGNNLQITKVISKLRDKYSFVLYNYLHIDPLASRHVLKYRDWRMPKLVIRSCLKELYLKIRPFDKIAHQKIYALVDKIILLSPNFIPEYLQLINITESSKVIAIENPNTYSENFSPEIITTKKKQVLVVSRMGETPKRLLRVLDVWSHVSQHIPDWKLLFIGDGPDLNTYKRIASKMNLNRIFFYGQQDPLHYYKESSILLMTSASEGFGMTLLEAQQCGVVPIVMNSYSAVTDIIIHGQNGLITESGNINEFANTLLSLTSNKEYREQLALSALKLSSRFSLTNILHKWENILLAINTH